MGKLTDAHVEQIQSMRKDGKKYAEIQQFFKDNYQIKLWNNDIARLCKDVKVPKEFRHTGRRGYLKRGKVRKTSKIVVEDGCKFKVICKFAENCKLEICKFIGV